MYKMSTENLKQACKLYFTFPYSQNTIGTHGLNDIAWVTGNKEKENFLGLFIHFYLFIVYST